MSLKTTISNYKKAKGVYLEIDKKFSDLEYEKMEDSEFNLNQLIVRLRDLKKYLRYIEINDLEGNYSNDKIDAITYNKQIFQDALYFWDRFFLRSKLSIDLQDPIKLKYIPHYKLNDKEIRQWGGSEKEAAKTFIAAITHPDNIIEYEKSIKRMVIGTMTQKEFNRIFDVIKYKMHKVNKVNEENMKIPTIKEYKLSEDFFNPFEDDKKLREKEPNHISDKGGAFLKRKETFNLARIEYSKRPGGEYTVLAKTQFAKGEIIEICPVIILGEEVKNIEHISDIIFEIDADANEWGLVLGYGSLYHHNENANVEYAYNKLTRQMYFITSKYVKFGEELKINYGHDYWMKRMDFNKMTDDIKRTDQNQGMPVISGKGVKKEIDESEVQPNASDIKGTDDIRGISSPRNPANPVISGVAIMGVGQS